MTFLPKLVRGTASDANPELGSVKHSHRITDIELQDKKSLVVAASRFFFPLFDVMLTSGKFSPSPWRFSDGKRTCHPFPAPNRSDAKEGLVDVERTCSKDSGTLNDCFRK